MRPFACVLLVLAASCSKDSSKNPPAKQEPAPVAQVPADTAPAPPPPAPRDPRFTEIVATGKDCTWNDVGLASCAADDAMRKLAFEQQGSSELAASCMGALRDPDPIVRGLAASCMKGFNDATRIPHLAAGLDAFEAEKEPTIKIAIAGAFSNGNARESGVEDRVVALVRKLAATPEGEMAASFLLDSMFPQYMMQKSDVPSKGAGDVALEMTKKTGRLQARAVEVVGLLTDRQPEACAALAEVVKTPRWSEAVDTMAKIGEPCAAHADPVIDVMVGAMAENKYARQEYVVTKKFLDRVTLTAAQNKKLLAATQKLERGAKGPDKKEAREVVMRCGMNLERSKAAPPPPE